MIRRRASRAGRATAVVLSLLCVLCLGAGGYMVWSNRTASTSALHTRIEGQDPNAQEGPLPGSSADRPSRGDDLFYYRINKNIKLNAKGEGDLNLENPSANQYLMVVELSDAEKQVLYQSQYIQPNQHLIGFKLDRSLPQGVYQGTVYINAVDPRTLQWVGALECPVTYEIG